MIAQSLFNHKLFSSQMCHNSLLVFINSLVSDNYVVNKQNSPYDYIVIGSGPGGTTIATRLALNNFNVLLIEAGPDYDGGDTRTPGFWGQTELNSEIIANFEPYLYSKENGRTILYPRAMTSGRSAQINVMVSMAVNPIEWDYIAEVTGDSHWNSSNMLSKYQPFIENCEYCSNNDIDKNKNGWFNISVAPLCQ